MVEPPELQSIVQAAAQAVGAGDFVSAERLLREVASRQETELGPSHPNLAKTLNNLGVVCEKAGRPDDAERCYRRAYAIAVSTLPSDDPFVVTSRRNLHDFCEARGLPFEPEAHSTQSVAPSTVPLPRSDSRVGGGRALAVTVLGLGLVLLAWYGPWRDSTEKSVGADTSSITPPAPSAAQAEDADLPPAADVPSAPAALRTPAPAPVEPLRTKDALVRTASAPVTISVVEARLCRSLSKSDWQCVPAESGSAPGPYYFYTRLASGRDATIRHRWYYEGRLQQSVALEVGANAKAGYRTYSRQTVAAERSGNWRVELLSPDGGLLYEERFVVR